MNILIAGNGRGSWEMRGRQIGAALGARVTSDPSAQDWGWADVAILLKKTAVTFAGSAHLARVPIVWDVLDCWSQPRDNSWSVQNGVQHVAAVRHQIKPAAVIGATQAMADAIGGTYIPHHCRIGLVPTPPRETVRTVAYDGSDRYLGSWEPAIRQACATRGWMFVINPPDLAHADLLVAFRDNQWDGPICRAWKSGVKVVNALCAGRPIVTQPSDACHEMETVIAMTERIGDLSGVLDIAAKTDSRDLAYERGLSCAHRFTADAIADTYYRPLLARVLQETSCAA